MKDDHSTRRDGFALLEALIAAAVLAIGLIALGQFHSRLIQASAESRELNEATYFAERQLDALREQPWDDLAVPSSGVVVVDPEVEGVPGTAGRRYRVEWSVSSWLDEADDDFFRRATATASLISPRNEPVQATLHTLLAQPRFPALLSPLENPGDGEIIEGKYQEGTYAEASRDDGLRIVLPQTEGDSTFETGDDVGFKEDADGDITEIIDLYTGDALVLGDSTGDNNGYAKLSGNLVFELSSPAVANDPRDPVNLLGIGSVADETQAAKFNAMLKVSNGICVVLPSLGDLYLSPLKSDLLASTLVESGGKRYRVLSYSCYVPNNWFGSVTADVRPYFGGSVVDVCTGSADRVASCDPDDPVTGSACGLEFRASDPGEPILGRAYIGFKKSCETLTAEDDRFEDECGDDVEQCVIDRGFNYVGISGSTVHGGAEFGSVCGTDTPDGGPLSVCLDQPAGSTQSLEGVEFLVPGGHHFLFANLGASATRFERFNACTAAMDKFEGGVAAGLPEFQFRGNLFRTNPFQYVCLTPETCGYFPRFSGFLPNEDDKIPDETYVLWSDVNSDAVLGRFCNVFGLEGNHAKVFWCVMEESESGRVNPFGVDGFTAKPERYHYATLTGGTDVDVCGEEFPERIDPKQVWSQNDFSDRVNRRMDLTRFDLVLTKGSGGESTLAPRISGKLTKGYSGNPQLAAATVSATGTGLQANGNCTRDFGNQGGTYYCNVPIGWAGEIKLDGVNGVSFSPEKSEFTDVTTNSSGIDFVATKP